LSGCLSIKSNFFHFKKWLDFVASVNDFPAFVIVGIIYVRSVKYFDCMVGLI